jgi:DNA-binding NarL/FixJ family response regulator
MSDYYPVEDEPERPLSPREVEVLQLIVDGKKYSAIALALGIEPGTVARYTWHIREKLKAASMANAVAIAMRQKFVT